MYFGILYNFFRGISIFLQIVNYVILAYCIASWILQPSSRLYELLRNMAWPFIAPFRGLSIKLMMKVGIRFDVSALLAIFALQLLGNVLWWVFGLLTRYM